MVNLNNYAIYYTIAIINFKILPKITFLPYMFNANFVINSIIFLFFNGYNAQLCNLLTMQFKTKASQV